MFCKQPSKALHSQCPQSTSPILSIAKLKGPSACMGQTQDVHQQDIQLDGVQFQLFQATSVAQLQTKTLIMSITQIQENNQASSVDVATGLSNRFCFLAGCSDSASAEHHIVPQIFCLSNGSMSIICSTPWLVNLCIIPAVAPDSCSAASSWFSALLRVAKGPSTLAWAESDHLMSLSGGQTYSLVQDQALGHRYQRQEQLPFACCLSQSLQGLPVWLYRSYIVRVAPASQ